ncbi:MAG TPA: hypothetical protein VG406_23665 [Isosphaeraceae bacterium]|jgi:hypothetical protein|nr:hypothetical protein [Isosphaeraceae bacterium]
MRYSTISKSRRRIVRASVKALTLRQRGVLTRGECDAIRAGLQRLWDRTA